MAECISHFAVKSIGLSKVNGRKPCTLLEAARHNLREIQAEQGAIGRIDPTRTGNNFVLQGPTSAKEVQAHATALLAANGVATAKLRRDHCQAIEAVFSLPPDSDSPDPAVYFEDCLKWFTGLLGLPVLSAVVHCDESAMHLHVLLLPVKDGAHVGSLPIDRAALKRLRDNFFAKVAGPAGLTRTGAKLRGMVKQWAITAVLHECVARGLPKALGQLWPVLVAGIKRDPTAAMMGLGIDANSIRPCEPQFHDATIANPIGIEANPIGIEANPIGIEKEGPENQTLSCVGIANQPPPEVAHKVPTSLPMASDAVNSKLQVTTPHSDRLSIARVAQKKAIDLHSPRNRATRLPDNGDTPYRVHDEHDQDLSAWND